MVNSVAILASSAAVATALEVAANTTLAPGDDAAATTQLLFRLSESFWGVGAVFFGLWLIPMGWVAATSGLAAPAPPTSVGGASRGGASGPPLAVPHSRPQAPLRIEAKRSSAAALHFSTVAASMPAASASASLAAAAASDLPGAMRPRNNASTTACSSVSKLVR